MNKLEGDNAKRQRRLSVNSFFTIYGHVLLICLLFPGCLEYSVAADNNTPARNTRKNKATTHSILLSRPALEDDDQVTAIDTDANSNIGSEEIALDEVSLHAMSDRVHRAKPSSSNVFSKPRSSISSTGASCEVRSSCAKSTSTHLTFAERNCFCDVLCNAYQDCCPDYETETEDKKIAVPSIAFFETVACLRVPEIDEDREIYLVTTCPKSFTDNFVSAACQNSNANSADGFHYLPVSGRTTGILYRNFFCALCSGDTNVTFWHAKFRCNDAPRGSGRTQQQMSAQDLLRSTLRHNRQQDCEVQYRHPNSSFQTRGCKWNIARCDRRWTNGATSWKCRSFTSYVYAGLNAFRNEHCAKCNFVNSSYIGCEDQRTLLASIPAPTDYLMQDDLAPFTVIVDLNSGVGIIQRRRISNNGESTEISEVTVELQQCPEENIYDPFADACRRVSCGDGLYFRDGYCTITPMTTKSNKKLPSSTTTVEWRNKTAVTPVIPSSLTTQLVLNRDSAGFVPTRSAAVKTVTRPAYITAIRKSTVKHQKKEQPVDDVNNPLWFPKNASHGQWCMPINEERVEFTRLDNGSIYFADSRNLYEPGEPTLHNQKFYMCRGVTTLSHNETAINHHKHSDSDKDNDMSAWHRSSQKVDGFAMAAENVIVMFRLTPMQQFISFVGSLVSMFCLLVQIAVFACCKMLRTTPQGKCLLSLGCSLVASQLLYVSGLFRLDVKEVCIGMAVGMHYFNLVAFFWTNALAIDFCRARVRQAKARVGGGSFAAYSLFCWVAPACVVMATVALEFAPVSADMRQFAPLYGTNGCWVSGKRGIVYFFILPIALLLAIDIVLYAVAAKNTFCMPPRQISHHGASIRSVGSMILTSDGDGTGTSSRTRERRSDKRRFFLYVSLTIYMAAVWTSVLASAFVRYSNEVLKNADKDDIALTTIVGDGTSATSLTYIFIVLYTILGPFMCLAIVCSTAVLSRLQLKLLGRQPSTRSPTSNRSLSRDGHTNGNASSNNYFPVQGRTYLFEGEIVSRETCI